MKKILIMMLILLVSVGAAYAERTEHETLLRGKTSSGFYGAPVTKYTKLDGEFGIMMGGRLGWIINHSFSIGVAGYGWANDLHGDFPFDWNNDSEINMGYGGIFLEGIVSSHKLFHLSTGLLLGAGAVERGFGVHYGHHDHFDFWDADAFWVAEPEVNLMVNVARFFRIGFGVSYRFVAGVDYEALSDSALSGFSGVITFKFGKF